MTDPADPPVSDDLFATHRVCGPEPTPPLIVVGLPRSGSSFLSHVLSQIEDWYVFDDLYLQDKAEGLGATGPLDDDALDELLFFLGWQIRARLRWGLYAIPAVAEDEVEPMNAALRATFAGQGAHWTALQAEWLTRLAHRGGCANWGYKQPKAFRSLDRLRTAYPGAKVLYLMRHPHDVLASYKHMRSSSQDGDPDQYHPLAHAVYWRMAATSYFDRQGTLGDDMMLMRFEDLVADPLAAGQRLATFLGAPVPSRITAPERANTSFSGNAARRGLTGLEARIVNAVCWPVAGRMGFDRRRVPMAAADPVDLATRSARFARYRLRSRTRWRTRRGD